MENGSAATPRTPPPLPALPPASPAAEASSPPRLGVSSCLLVCAALVSKGTVIFFCRSATRRELGAGRAGLRGRVPRTAPLRPGAARRRCERPPRPATRPGARVSAPRCPARPAAARIGKETRCVCRILKERADARGGAENERAGTRTVARRLGELREGWWMGCRSARRREGTGCGEWGLCRGRGLRDAVKRQEMVGGPFPFV